jgi:hypothetical protein
MTDLKTGGSPARTDPWSPLATATHSQVVADHEQNPEYEVHVGRPVHADGQVRRYASLWLRGERFCGWLVAGEPAPDQVDGTDRTGG